MRRSAAAAARERGSATVLVLGLAAVLAASGAVVSLVGVVAVTRHRAASAADLAALAAADGALGGPSVACAAAQRAAEAVAAVLEQCVLVGDVADVVVAVHPVGALRSWGEAHAHSRAGPSRR